MLCKGTVPEPSGKKSCWLPADPFEPHGLCRRCLFHAHTDWLDGLRGSNPRYAILNDRSFVLACLHPARQQALIATLTHLFQTDKQVYQTFLSKLQAISEFSLVLSKRFDGHSAGPRCSLYQNLLTQKVFSSPSICKSCWKCITWCIQTNTCMETFPLQFLERLRTLSAQVYLRDSPNIYFLCLEALHLKGKDHYCRLFLDHLTRIVSLEQRQEFAIQLLCKEPFLQTVFLGTLSDLFPQSFLTESFLRHLKQQVYRAQKNRCDQYKEELMMRTWHPSRLFSWCFDLEELKDFADL